MYKFYFWGCFNFNNHEVIKGKGKKKEKCIQSTFQGEKKFLLKNGLAVYLLKKKIKP